MSVFEFVLARIAHCQTLTAALAAEGMSAAEFATELRRNGNNRRLTIARESAAEVREMRRKAIRQ